MATPKKKAAVKKRTSATANIWAKAKSYVGIKQIAAVPMSRGGYNRYRGWKMPVDEDARDAGFIVMYPDGYISWSPAKQFEDAYMTDKNLDFSAALFLLKQGHKLARKGWNGKKQFVFHVPANSYSASGNKNGTLNGMFPGNKVPYDAYFAIKNAQNTVSPWLASQGDLIATDWCIIE